MAQQMGGTSTRPLAGGGRARRRAAESRCRSGSPGADAGGGARAAAGAEATATGRRGAARCVALGGLAWLAPGEARRGAAGVAVAGETSSFNTVYDDAGAALLRTDAITIPPIPRERFAPAEVALSVPSALWKSRGQMKPPAKKLLYTDTYGPSNQYRFELPRWVNSVDGSSCLTGLSVSVQPAPGTYESIDEIGNINDIDVQVLDLPGDVESADIMYAKPRYAAAPGAAGGRAYYQWDLAIPDATCARAICPYAEVVLVSATISGGGLYVASIRANQDEWLAQEGNLKKLRDSFSVTSAEVSSLDTSSRVYGN